MGGPYPFQSPPRRLYSRAGLILIPDYTAYGLAPRTTPHPGVGGWPQGPMPPLWGGNTLARRLAGSCLPIPWCILPDGPPNTRGPLEVLVGLFTDFYRLSWETF